jgi:hypothetical protein
MKQQTRVSLTPPSAAGGGFHLEALVHPWRVFTHPSEVLAHPALSRQEKRAVLASWASDAYTVESAPALRCPPGSETPVRLADILDALRALDGEDAARSDAAPRHSWFHVWRPAGTFRWSPARKPHARAKTIN